MRFNSYAKVLLAVWLFFLDRLEASRNHRATNGTEIVNRSNICNTETCHQVAKALIESMNQTVDPCDDFYQFSCGNWELRNPAPKYEIRWSATEQFTFLARTRLKKELNTQSTSNDISPIQHMKKLYKSCMNNGSRELEGLQKIEAILRETKGWPMIMNDDIWNNNSITWQEVDNYYGNSFGLHAFFTVNIPDIPSEHIRLEFDGPILPMRQKDVKFERNYTSDSITEYRSVIRKIARLFIQQNKANVSDEKLERDINDLLIFEQSLYEAQENRGSSIWVNNIHSMVQWWRTVIAIANPRGKIDWETILQNLCNIRNRPITNKDVYVIKNTRYLRRLVRILESTDERTIVNYIQWKFLSIMLPYTTEEMNDIIFDFKKNSLRLQKKEPRWLKCVKQIETHHAAAYLFARKYYPNNSKAAVNEMIKNLKASLKLQIENSNWLLNDAKRAAIEKLNRLSVLTGYPNWYDNETALLDYYRNIKIVDSYFENILELAKLEWREDVNRWGQSTKQMRWSDNVLQASSMHHRLYNIITIVAATLQCPPFDEGLPDYVKYGIIGTIIAQELGHGFDSTGISVGADPNRLLFGKNARKIYMERAGCFNKKLNKYFEGGPDNSSSINEYNEAQEKWILDESLAEWIGLEVALDAYKTVKNQKMPNEDMKLPELETFTDEQLYFIAYAQKWCAARSSLMSEKSITGHETIALNEIRVLFPLSNNREFARIFKCSKNSPMNPLNKCNIWMNQTITP